MKPIKFAVAFVIYNNDRSKILIVRRPFNDKDLPGVWGLPAGSLKNNETYEECLVRSGKEKLGVDLKPIKFIGSDKLEREDYILYMNLYEAEIIKGEPRVPQPVEGVTQYLEWKWGEPSDLLDAAQKGSLCCRIYLKSVGTNLTL